jgi:hypothetical protein
MEAHGSQLFEQDKRVFGVKRWPENMRKRPGVPRRRRLWKAEACNWVENQRGELTALLV